MKKINYVRQMVDIRIEEFQKDRERLLDVWDADFIDGMIYGLEIAKNELSAVDGMSEDTMKFLIDFRKMLLEKKN